MNQLISYKNISISLSGKLVLDIPSLVIYPHQCTLLTGKNGSGKTTLFKVMSGLMQANGTTVEYQGLEMTWKQAKPRLQRDTVYLHQQPYLFDDTVSNNIAYGLYRQGESKHSTHLKITESLDWAGLSHLAHRPAKQLSGGEKQRVALSRARILAPRLLLLDEPTASMDSDAKKQTVQLLLKLKEEGTTIMISSHEPHVLEQLADSHLIIADGHVDKPMSK